MSQDALSVFLFWKDDARCVTVDKLMTLQRHGQFENLDWQGTDKAGSSEVHTHCSDKAMNGESLSAGTDSYSPQGKQIYCWNFKMINIKCTPKNHKIFLLSSHIFLAHTAYVCTAYMCIYVHIHIIIYIYMYIHLSDINKKL